MDGSVGQDTGQAGAAVVWINAIVCMPGSVAMQAKIICKVGFMLAKLKSIEMALVHCQITQQREKKINIFTDCLCVLQVLQKLTPSDNVESINKIQARHYIHFYWIPSHAGIQYNEIADRIADRAKPTYS